MQELHNVCMNPDLLTSLSEMLRSGLYSDVWLHAGRQEKENIKINSLFLAAMGGEVASLMKEEDKGDSGVWEIFIPEVNIKNLRSALMDLFTWSPRSESIILLEELSLFRKGFYTERNFLDIHVIKEEEKLVEEYDTFDHSMGHMHVSGDLCAGIPT